MISPRKNAKNTKDCADASAQCLVTQIVATLSGEFASNRIVAALSQQSIMKGRVR